MTFTTRQLERGAWGVYEDDGILLAAAFGECAEARAELISAAFELSVSLNKPEDVEEATPVVVQADFRCAVEEKPMRDGQRTRCREQCVHCRTVEARHAAATP